MFETTSPLVHHHVDHLQAKQPLLISLQIDPQLVTKLTHAS